MKLSLLEQEVLIYKSPDWKDFRKNFHTFHDPHKLMNDTDNERPLLLHSMNLAQ